MSISENDFDDELLELIGASEKKRKKSQSSGRSSATKRRKADVSDSDNEPESEEDDSHPYPLEDKYIDEADRQRLLEMSEIEREEILAQRQEDLQKLKDKRNLDQMFKAQRSGDPDAVSKAAKRAHAARGATKEKTRKLDELKARRKAKDDKKRTQHDSVKQERSASPMEMSSGEEEDGQITKYEQEEERDRRLFDKSQLDDEPAILADFEKCRLTRNFLVEWHLKPSFEDLIKGAWVRYLDRSERGQNIYRICEVSGFASSTKPYKVENEMVDQVLELKYTKFLNKVSWDRVSNGPFTEGEFQRLQKASEDEHVKLPSKRVLERKHAQIIKILDQRLTDNDVTAMLARRNAIQPKRPSFTIAAMERSRLEQELTLAVRRKDLLEVKMIQAKLDDLNPPTIPVISDTDDRAERLAQVNERNRKANLEAVRQAEAFEAERKRRERKLVAAGKVSTPVDPSARLKTVPRVFEPSSKAITPNGTPKVGPQVDSPSRFMSPVPQLPMNPSPVKKSLESSMVQHLEIDLIDF